MKYLKKVLILFLVIITAAFTVNSLKADSGWDSDYDSGSDWGSDWGSSWDSDYSSGGSYSGSSADAPGILVTVVVIIIIAVVVNIAKNKGISGRTSGYSSLSNTYNDLSEDYIHSVDPALDIAEFKREVFRIYKDVQIAWMNFDYEALRNLVTDEMYNMYKSQLETLKLKGQKNVMSDFSLIDVKITNITKENGLININAYLNIRMKDYVINESTKEVVRGTDKRFMNIAYNITFIKKEEAKTIENCPNCGAHIDVVSSTKCPYCDTTIVVDSNKYVMSKKTSLSQRME